MTEGALYIGIDVGTSGCRAEAVDDAGASVARATAGLEPPRRDGDHVRQRPELWWQACTQALQALADQVAMARVQAVAVDGTSGTVLLTDADGRPLGDALMYNDSGCRKEAARVAEAAPADSGAHGSSAGLPKLLHLLERHGAAGPRHVLHQADWIAARLSGRTGISDANNCLKLGYDVVAREWPDWLEDLGVDPALLPEVLAPGDMIGPVAPAVAAQFGLPPEARVVAGTTDSIAAFLATGARAPGEAVTSLGSTLAVKMIAERPIFAPELGIYSHRLGDHWLAGGASNSGGAVLRQFFTQAQLDALTPQLDAERPTGLDYYPLSVPGERFPVNDPNLAPRLEPRPDDDRMFFQGLLEGIAAIEAQGYARLQELGAPALTRVLTAGGGAANPAWTRIRQRLLGVPVEAAPHQEAAYGAALLARRGVTEPSPHQPNEADP